MTRESVPERRILALVDDLIAASRIEATLVAAGYAVRTISATVSAVEVAREWRADAVVVSFGVPFSDWEGALRALRGNPALRTIPVLAFGPHVDLVGREAARSAGATRVVTNGAFFNRMPEMIAGLFDVGGRKPDASSQ